MTRLLLLSSASVFATSLALTGCDCNGNPTTDSGMSDAGPTDDAPPGDDAFAAACEAPVPFERGSADGAADPLTIPAGQSRVGRVTEAMLPADPRGLAVWKAGDFVMASSSGVALVIEDVGVSDLYDRYGGRPVGIAAVEGGRLTHAGNFNEILLGFSTFLVETESVTVMNDGSDGNAAVVRVTGPLGPIDFAGALIDAFSGGNRFEGWPASLEYRLEPGADHIDMTITVDNITNRAGRVARVLHGVFQGSRMPMLTPEAGFDVPEGNFMTRHAVYADGRDEMSWALVPPGDTMLTQLANLSGVSVFDSGSLRYMPCERVTASLGAIALGRGVSGAQGAAMRMQGMTTRVLHGQVRDVGGVAAPGVRVHALQGTAYYSRAISDASGNFEMVVPTGAALNLQAFRRGQSLTAPQAITATEDNVTVTMPAFGTLHVVESASLPVRIQVAPATGAPPAIPDAFGEPDVVTGRTRVDFASAGDASLILSPGTYDVTVSRGYEYELHRQRVTIAAGATAEVTTTLNHSVDTTGWMCADYHIHTTRSPDADDDANDKVLALAADGLEIAIRSDHEFAADFQPNVVSLGLQNHVFGIAGEEMTTFTWGHFNVFPMVIDNNVRNGHIPNVYGVLPPAAFAELRARPEQPAIIINHPRTSGPGFGYFNVAEYDATTGMVGSEEYWDEQFNVVEVFNDSDFNFNRGETVADWFSFLNRSRRVFAVGSSDSHHLMTAPTGYPRTCLHVNTDNPTMLTANQVRDMTSAGHSYISGGIRLNVEGPDNTGPGDTAMGVGAMTQVHVIVEAATWIGVGESGMQLEVIVDGVTTEMMTLPVPMAGETVRFEGDINVPVAAAGSWVVIHASSDDDMVELHPGRAPFAVSNPIFLQR